MKMMYKKMQIVSLLLLMCGTTTLLAERKAEPVLKLPAIFGNHMVLQQGREIPVWGWTEPGRTVQITLANQSVTTQADPSGKWMGLLPALPASKVPIEMSVESGGEVITFSDVLLGDVWLCSGQSNMAMGVGAVKNSDEIIANADHPQIRMFLVKNQVAYEPAADLEGQWVVCSPEGILMDGGWKGFSAVGYFFGRAIQQTRNIPVGLIGSYVGGTTIFTWMSEETLASYPMRSAPRINLDRFLAAKAELPEAIRQYQEVLKPAWDKAYAERNAIHAKAFEAWRAEADLARSKGSPIPPRPTPGQLPRPPGDPMNSFFLASVLYNGMIHPLAPFPLTGIIWYQGEANAYPGMAEAYEDNLSAMIEHWRTLWGQDDLPFLYVQLPNLISEKDTWPILRESQRKALKTPHTGMVVTIDVGDPDDLHPPEKIAIGQRLGLLARKQVYGEDIVASGPMIQSGTPTSQGVRLTFDSIGTGLSTAAIQEGDVFAAATNEPLRGFETAGADGRFIPAKATIDGINVIVLAEEGLPIQSVRYAWAPDPDGNLYNREGLPASPFEIAVE